MCMARIFAALGGSLVSAALSTVLLATPLRAADDASALLVFEEVSDGKCQILSAGGKLVVLRNVHPERTIRYRLVRVFRDIPQGRVDGEIAAGGPPQKLGCSRVDQRVQTWRIERATLEEAAK